MCNSGIQYQFQSNTTGRPTVSSVIPEIIWQMLDYSTYKKRWTYSLVTESMERQLSTIPELTHKVSLTSNKMNKSFQ